MKYHGYTIICKLKDTNILKGLENLIENSKTLGRYVVPTPSSSYHMTITGIDNRVIDLKSLQKLKNLCKKHASPIEAIVKDVYFGDTPGIYLDVDHDVTILRNLLRASVGMKEESYSYHMTFGYKFRTINPEDYDGYLDDVTKIKKYIFSIFPKFENTMKLNAAVVCEFDDMTEFKNII